MKWAGPLNHPRLDNIEFISDGHIYTVHGTTVPQSGTGVLKPRFPFDAWKIVRKYYPKWKNDGMSRYFEIIAEHYDCEGNGDEDAMAAIVQSWADLGEKAAPRGTQMHADIEHHVQGIAVAPSKELEQYNAVAARLGDAGWEVAGVEVLIYYEVPVRGKKLLIFAGAIDMLCRHRGTGAYRMIDHKRVPEKKGRLLGEPYGKRWPFEKAGAPFELRGNCSDFKYAAQLNLYAFALKHRYGIDCEGRLDLLQMHEELPRGHLVRVPSMEPEIQQLLDMECERLLSEPDCERYMLPLE